MVRLLLACAPLLLVAVQPPASAQTGASASDATAKCQQKKKKRGLFGSVAGGLINQALGQAGVPSGVGGVYIPVGSLITEGIAKLLDCKEQVQAATATQEAVRGGVGTTASWQSETRPNVSGSSTVTGQTARADGATCLTVNDVVIVNGEEATVAKTMCRTPGSSGYVLQA